MIKIIKGKPIKGIEEALREQIAYEKKVSKTFERMAIKLKQQVNELKAELCGMEDELAQANRRIEELEAELEICDAALEGAQHDAEICKATIEGTRWRMQALVKREDVIETLTKRYELVSETDIKNTVNSVTSAEQCCEGTCDECGECRI